MPNRKVVDKYKQIIAINCAFLFINYIIYSIDTNKVVIKKKDVKAIIIPTTIYSYQKCKYNDSKIRMIPIFSII